MAIIFFGVLLIVLFLSVLTNHVNERTITSLDRMISIQKGTIRVKSETIDILTRTIEVLESQLEDEAS